MAVDPAGDRRLGVETGRHLVLGGNVDDVGGQAVLADGAGQAHAVARGGVAIGGRVQGVGVQGGHRPTRGREILSMATLKILTIWMSC